MTDSDIDIIRRIMGKKGSSLLGARSWDTFYSQYPCVGSAAALEKTSYLSMSITSALWFHGACCLRA